MTWAHYRRILPDAKGNLSSGEDLHPDFHAPLSMTTVSNSSVLEILAV